MLFQGSGLLTFGGGGRDLWHCTGAVVMSDENRYTDREHCTVAPLIHREYIPRPQVDA